MFLIAHFKSNVHKTHTYKLDDVAVHKECIEPYSQNRVHFCNLCQFTVIYRGRMWQWNPIIKISDNFRISVLIVKPLPAGWTWRGFVVRLPQNRHDQGRCLKKMLKVSSYLQTKHLKQSHQWSTSICLRDGHYRRSIKAVWHNAKNDIWLSFQMYFMSLTIFHLYCILLTVMVVFRVH